MSNGPVSIMNKTAQFLRASDSRVDIDHSPSSFMQFNYSKEINMMKTPEGQGHPLNKFPPMKDYESPTFPRGKKNVISQKKIV
mmetsp:Transcript_2592/g.4014  ORF Transcript_2592/g.4014 Transcript_2592/m.4014 type:complete len:83 (+) Transcript_2592:1513-1761(+)